MAGKVNVFYGSVFSDNRSEHCKLKLMFKLCNIIQRNMCYSAL